MIKMTIPIEPVGQLRLRATRYGRTHVYDPQKTSDFKKAVNTYARWDMKQRRLQRIEGKPIHVNLHIYRPVQKSLSKKERELRLSDVHKPTVKYDIDNYIKAIFDALNGVIWDDDRYIISVYAIKHYTDRPRIEIVAKELEDESDGTGR